MTDILKMAFGEYIPSGFHWGGVFWSMEDDANISINYITERPHMDMATPGGLWAYGSNEDMCHSHMFREYSWDRMGHCHKDHGESFMVECNADGTRVDRTLP